MLSSWSKTSFAFVTSWLPLLLLLSVESSDGGNFSIVAESKMAPLRILLVVGCLLVVVIVIGVEAAGGPASSSSPSSDIVMPGTAGVVIVPEARMSSEAAIVAVIYAREPPLAFETMATPVKMTLPHKVLKG